MESRSLVLPTRKGRKTLVFSGMPASAVLRFLAKSAGMRKNPISLCDAAIASQQLFPSRPISRNGCEP